MQILPKIVGYFPYAPEMSILNYKQDYVGIAHAPVDGYYMYADSPCLTYDGGSVGKHYGIECLLYLHPLECILEEALTGEDKIIPIVELVKVVCPEAKDIEYRKYKTDYEATFTYDGDRFMLLIQPETAEEDVILYKHDFTVSLLDQLVPGDKRYTPELKNCSMRVIQKLYEMHIDIHGLIPQGLALDKIELTK